MLKERRIYIVSILALLLITTILMLHYYQGSLRKDEFPAQKETESLTNQQDGTISPPIQPDEPALPQETEPPTKQQDRTVSPPKPPDEPAPQKETPPPTRQQGRTVSPPKPLDKPAPQKEPPPPTKQRDSSVSPPKPPDGLAPQKGTQPLANQRDSSVSPPKPPDGLAPQKGTQSPANQQGGTVSPPTNGLAPQKGTQPLANQQGGTVSPPTNGLAPQKGQSLTNQRDSSVSPPKLPDGLAPQKGTQPLANQQGGTVSPPTNGLAPQKGKQSPNKQPSQTVSPPKPLDRLAPQKETDPLTKGRDSTVSPPRPPNKPLPPRGMVLIPAGEFQMGTDELTDVQGTKKIAAPVHLVYLDAFYMDAHEVTVGKYKAFLLESGYTRSLPSIVSELAPTDTHPVVGVSWHDAMAYAKWAGKRLPTEAEWERAARGPKLSGPYPWTGKDIGTSRANYNGDKGGISPVGQYQPNGYGLYDMAGNVAEWCLDPWFNDFYQNSPRENPFAGFKARDETIADFKQVKGMRVIRGGAWDTDALGVRVERRRKMDGAKRYSNLGFRCAKDAQ